MYLLAIDTATGNFSLALYSDVKRLELFEAREANKQAENLIPEIEALLARHELEYSELNYIAANIGPGSFTGLRIGLAAVKALELVLPFTPIAVTSLEAAALQKGGGEVHLDARRGGAFAQNFDLNLQAISESELIDYIGEFDEPANADFIAQMALHKLKIGAELGEIKPLYIREADAKLPKAEQLI